MRRLTVVIIAALATAAAAQPPAPDPTLEIYAKPQLLVPLAGGRRIHLYCMGRGAPTVMLTAGQGGWASSWSKVQPSIAQRTRVCAWDRAGYGFSDGSTVSQTVANTSADLDQALKAARIIGPYVMVAHSAGSYETLLFADRHKSKVAGMVLVDPSIPGQAARFVTVSPKGAAVTQQGTAQQVAQLRICADKLAGPPLTDAETAKCFSYRPDFPPQLIAALTKLDHEPARLRSKASLAEQFDANSRTMVNPRRDYGNMPLIVLTAANTMAALPPEARPDADALSAEFRKGHDELAALSRRGVNQTVEGSGHNIQADKPQVVIDAINEIIDTARAAR
jgi:pimeloyl-ACP methyl ester carboxylesterase